MDLTAKALQFLREILAFFFVLFHDKRGMGIISAVTHNLLAVVIKAAIMWIAFMFVFHIAIDQAGWVMICAFIAEFVGSLVASLLLRGSRGY